MGRILYYCSPEMGHFNASLCIAKELQTRHGNKHQMCFVVNDLWAGILPTINPDLVMCKYVEPPDQAKAIAEIIAIATKMLDYPEEDKERTKLFCQILVLILNYNKGINIVY